MWFSKFLLLFCALSSNIYVHAKHSQTSTNLEDEKIYQKYVEMDKNIKGMVNRGIKMLLPYVMEANEYLNLSSSCMRDAFQLVSRIRKLELPALKMLDAVGKIPEGIFLGNIIHMLGDYDECMTTSILRADGSVAFQGKYCMIHIRPFLPKKKGLFTIDKGFEGLKEAVKNSSEVLQHFASAAHFFYYEQVKIGVCVPSGCSVEDLSQIVNYINYKTDWNNSVAYCNQQNDRPVSLGKTIAITAYSVVGFLVVIGTCVDYYSRKTTVTFKNIIIRLLLCFSILSNFPKLISTKISDKSMSSLTGIRCLSLFYVILQHHYFCLQEFPIHVHIYGFKEEIQKFFFQIIANGCLTTEVFFFLSGLLNMYIRMKFHKRAKEKLSFIAIIIHRLWRMYPVYIFGILMFYFLSDAQGPVRTRAGKIFWNNCDKNWWQNILFINNFFHQRDTCMGHTWYIAADMQIFLISLFTVPVILRNAKQGIILHAAILFSGVIGTVLWAWHKSLLPAFIVYRIDSPTELYKVWNAYTTPLPHIAPYFTGLLTGYILCTWKDFKIPLVYQILGWPVAAASLLSMIFITQKWNSGAEIALVEGALYFAFCKLLYVLAVAWLVVCCVRGYGGIFNYILSLKIWIPITRLSYMMYMISLPLQVFFVTNSRVVMDTHIMVLIWQYMGELSIIALMALAMCVTVESPFITMEKILFGRSSTMLEGNARDKTEMQNNIADKNIQTQIDMEKNIKNTFGNMQLTQEKN